MTATLYGIPASHPVYAATLMLERKGIEYRRIDLPQWFHRPLLRILRFPGTTVPALVLDGRRLQTTKAIARALDSVKPDPPLVPADPDERARVEAVETWCDGDFQQMGRRLVYWALVRHGAAVDSYLEGSRLILPRVLVKPLAPAVIRILAASTGRATRPSGRTSPRCPACSTGSTGGSPRACSAAPSPT